MSRALGIRPDLIVVGKGMTAGFHPLSGLLYRSHQDILEQYDAISTNGGASLAAFVALCSLELIDRHRERLGELAGRHYAGLQELVREFPDVLEEANGAGFLSGLKFRDREDALGCHRAALARGLWLRAHAYHPGHRTVLMKFPLAVDEPVIDFLHDQLRDLLGATPWR
jgi:acetylornithine/succinyldiaminopimelate/putrescine aminotransferase